MMTPTIQCTFTWLLHAYLKEILGKRLKLKRMTFKKNANAITWGQVPYTFVSNEISPQTYKLATN